MNLKQFEKFAPAIVRISMALVFLYFGISQVIDQEMWTGYLPEWIVSFATPSTVVYMNGIFEIILGTLLLLGLFVRICAFLLGLHLLGITAIIGFNAVGVRDFGLAMATLATAITGEDELCLSRITRK